MVIIQYYGTHLILLLYHGTAKGL